MPTLAGRIQTRLKLVKAAALTRSPGGAALRDDTDAAFWALQRQVEPFMMTTPERLRLDTDWYESTLHELEHLWPRLASGGVLIIDDYGHWQGARKAVDEFFDKRPQRPMLHRVDYTGRTAIKP